MCLAIPGKIIQIEEKQDPAFRVGKVSFDGTVRQVNLSMVPDAKLNDYVLVHVGVALNTVDEEEALRVFDYLRGLVDLEEETGGENNPVGT